MGIESYLVSPCREKTKLFDVSAGQRNIEVRHDIRWYREIWAAEHFPMKKRMWLRDNKSKYLDGMRNSCLEEHLNKYGVHGETDISPNRGETDL